MLNAANSIQALAQTLHKYILNLIILDYKILDCLQYMPAQQKERTYRSYNHRNHSSSQSSHYKSREHRYNNRNYPARNRSSSSEKDFKNREGYKNSKYQRNRSSSSDRSYKQKDYKDRAYYERDNKYDNSDKYYKRSRSRSHERSSYRPENQRNSKFVYHPPPPKQQKRHFQYNSRQKDDYNKSRFKYTTRKDSYKDPQNTYKRKSPSPAKIQAHLPVKIHNELAPLSQVKDYRQKAMFNERNVEKRPNQQRYNPQRNNNQQRYYPQRNNQERYNPQRSHQQRNNQQKSNPQKQNNQKSSYDRIPHEKTQYVSNPMFRMKNFPPPPPPKQNQQQKKESPDRKTQLVKQPSPLMMKLMNESTKEQKSLLILKEIQKMSPLRRELSQKKIKEPLEKMPKETISQFQITLQQARHNLSTKLPNSSFLMLDAYKVMNKFQIQTLDKRLGDNLKQDFLKYTEVQQSFMKKISEESTNTSEVVAKSERKYFLWLKQQRNEEQADLKFRLQEFKQHNSQLSDLFRKLKFQE